MPTVKVGDINIYYETHGDGEPLLMIQGYGQYAGHWTTLIPPFSKEYRVIVFDNRGTGRSDKPEAAYAMKMMAADARGLLDAIGIEAAHVFGVSMGGMIAQEFALNYPDRVISLVLGCTQCGGAKAVPPTPEALAFLFSTEMAKLSVAERARQTAPWLWSKEFINKYPEAVEAYVEITSKYPTPPHGFACQAQAITGHNTYDRLPEIKAPTLVIVGSGDRIIQPENSKILASVIPGAELVIVPNAGHGFTESLEATKAILDFLKRHTRGKKKA
ncbi:MAG: alpha/beta fold hydrolase [Dehalococcoidia bacterium]|nr:alpha/beta fold hydrolase [Dehalococcoidia bacterium]